jgi:hypothetical protein
MDVSTVNNSTLPQLLNVDAATVNYSTLGQNHAPLRKVQVTVAREKEKHLERKMQYCPAITAVGKGSTPKTAGYACGPYLYYLRNCPTYCGGSVVSVLYYKKRRSWLV